MTSQQQIAERIHQAECELIRRGADLDDYKQQLKDALADNNYLLASTVADKLEIAQYKYDALQQEIHDAQRSLE